MNKLGLLEKARLNSRINRINAKMKKIEKTFGRSSSEFKRFTQLLKSFNLKVTKSGMLSKRNVISNERLEKFEKINTVADTKKEYEKEYGLSNLRDIIDQKKIDDDLISNINSVKEYHYEQAKEEGFFEKGVNPLDLSNKEKITLAKQLKDFKENKSTIGSSKLEQGVYIPTE